MCRPPGGSDRIFYFGESDHKNYRTYCPKYGDHYGTIGNKSFGGEVSKKIPQSDKNSLSPLPLKRQTNNTRAVLAQSTRTIGQKVCIQHSKLEGRQTQNLVLWRGSNSKMRPVGGLRRAARGCEKGWPAQSQKASGVRIKWGG